MANNTDDYSVMELLDSFIVDESWCDDPEKRVQIAYGIMMACGYL